MIAQETIDEIVRLRIAGHSIRRIADQLNVGKNTVLHYIRKLEPQIDAERFAQVEERMNELQLLRTHRLERIHADLQKVESELDARPLSELSAADLMRLKSKLLGDVRKELQSQRVLVAERRHEKLSGAIQIERQYVELDK